jgi:hypothetical protein
LLLRKRQYKYVNFLKEMKSILLSTFVVGALSSKLSLTSVRNKNLRASFNGDSVTFKLGIDEVTSDLRIEVLDKSLIVQIGAQSNFTWTAGTAGTAADPGNMTQTMDDWTWDSDLDRVDGVGPTGTTLEEQIFNIKYRFGVQVYDEPLTASDCNDSGDMCSYTINSGLSGGDDTEVVYIAACQKDNNENNQMTCSIQQINNQGQISTDVAEKLKFSTYFPMEVMMNNGTNCVSKCVDGYGKMTEGFEVNTAKNGNKPNSEQYTNEHTAYQKIQADAYCRPESVDDTGRRRLQDSAPSEDSYITYSAGCTRPNSLGSTCDICD